MNRKRLHIHSLPLVLVAATVTVATAGTAAAIQSSSIVASLLRPAMEMQPLNRGLVSITPHTEAAAEQPGLTNKLSIESELMRQPGYAGEAVIRQLPAK